MAERPAMRTFSFYHMNVLTFFLIREYLKAKTFFTPKHRTHSFVLLYTCRAKEKKNPDIAKALPGFLLKNVSE